jgi:hypothetical protein
MMGRFDLKDYVEVKDRIPLFLESHPDGRIITEIVHLDFAATPPTCVIRAELYRDHEATEPMATGLAYERESGMINKTSFVENCETSAVGRALANANFAGTGPRPSREEMEKVERAEAELDQMVDRVRSLYADETGKARQAADAAIRERNFSRLQAAIKHKEQQA